MDSLPIQILILLVWLGAGAYGIHRLLQQGYKVGRLRFIAFYIAPAIAVLHLIVNSLQPLDASWPSNLPGSALNILIMLTLLVINPGWLLASYLTPSLRGLEPAAATVKRVAFSTRRSWLVFASLIFLTLVLPLVGLSLLKAAPSYTGVLGIVINGLLNGSLFALIALGYTLVYGIVELINFAHGDVFMIGSLTGFAVITTILNINPKTGGGRAVPTSTSLFMVFVAIIAAVIVAMIVCAGINYLIDRIAYKRLRNAPRLAPLITAIGFSFILQNIGLYLNSSVQRSYPIMFPNEQRQRNIDLILVVFKLQGTGIQISVTAILVIISAAALLLGLRYLINSTKIGKAMRAVAQSREAAALMGINIERTISFAFLLGGAMAGAAGVIFGIYQYSNTVRYDLGFTYGLIAFTSAVLGGIGNVNGAVLGGFFIGLLYELAKSNVFYTTGGFLDLTQWALVTVFVVLVLVMVFRPTGILGDNVQEKV